MYNIYMCVCVCVCVCVCFCVFVCVCVSKSLTRRYQTNIKIPFYYQLLHFIYDQVCRPGASEVSYLMSIVHACNNIQ